MANLSVSNLNDAPIGGAEFGATRDALQSFLQRALKEIQDDPKAKSFRVLIEVSAERFGVATLTIRGSRSKSGFAPKVSEPKLFG